MKKLILAGIIIIICCLVFLIVRQNSSRADISVDSYYKNYPVPFGDWVYVYLCATLETTLLPHYVFNVEQHLIEHKARFKIKVAYSNTEIGQDWYQNTFPKLKAKVIDQCLIWTAQGYPISLNDFEFDIRAY